MAQKMKLELLMAGPVVWASAALVILSSCAGSTVHIPIVQGAIKLASSEEWALPSTTSTRNLQGLAGCVWQEAEATCQMDASEAVWPPGSNSKFDSVLTQFNDCLTASTDGTGLGVCKPGSPTYCETKVIAPVSADYCLPITSTITTVDDISALNSAVEMSKTCDAATAVSISKDCMQAFAVRMQYNGCNCTDVLSFGLDATDYCAADESAALCSGQAPSPPVTDHFPLPLAPPAPSTSQNITIASTESAAAKNNSSKMSKDGTYVPAIAGAVVGALVMLAVLAGIIVWMRKREAVAAAAPAAEANAQTMV